MSLPTIMTAVSTVIFFGIERIWPGRKLPMSKGWYTRALLINLCQLSITLGLGGLWTKVYGAGSLLNLASWDMPFLEGFSGWFVGTFVFYWWHRARHRNGLWQVFHQIHHSPTRIEILTSFYKHPVEIGFNSFLTAALLFPLLGCSLMASFWYNFFAATGEFFYHGNYKSPKWLRYFVQTPELHSIHHQEGVHRYNYGDIPIWDRLFGTYKDTTEFAPRCGFVLHREGKLAQMLVFQDVHKDSDA
ncbi:MAG: sterol desaturase/sphingolipid hydroxylase (fatty acid hydroxylase superfamily) [Planctomycetota bacterium]|jgi:sterol desaturase/sphingolipid hydroxylase (fatty acid hydroxylase superfamily)